MPAALRIQVPEIDTLRKQTKDVFGAFKRALDALAEDERRNPYKLLFDSS